VRLASASTLEPARLCALFNEGFSDYLVPLQMSEAVFSDHIAVNDIDLDCSRVATCERPVALALIARRGRAAWVGGMGTAPTHRRRGLGERALVAGLESAAGRGCREVWLEVLDGNPAAATLYEKLGFEVVRQLIVWSLPAPGGSVPTSRPVEPDQARAWIAAHRPSHEPWQRADRSVDAIRARGARLQALMVDRDGQVAGAVVFREDADLVTALQIAAVDDASAAEVLLAATDGDRGLRLSNAPAGEPVSRALAQLGARAVAHQHEMRLDV
jgi:GNAT superfamily N-acetyltransferase